MPDPASDRDGCLSADELAALAEGDALDRSVTLHLDACSRCRRALSALAGASRPASPPPGLEDTDVDPGGSAGAPTVGPSAGDSLGRFALLRKLGQGAMGEVWAARDPELDREVAIKLLRLRRVGLGTQATRRLRREAQAMARLSHPNVVAIYELGTDGDRLFCAMELIEGATLRAWLETPRGWRAIVGVAIALGRGLAAAHAVGLIHRDVKPDNVLVARDGRAMVTDFGLAKLVEDADDEVARAGAAAAADAAARNAAAAILPRVLWSTSDPDPTLDDGGAGGRPAFASMTATGMAVGTPAYMAPEQLLGGRVGAASDQFAFCVMVYEALFGARPYSAATIDELAAALASGAARRPTRGQVPRAVVAALLRGLGKEPERRWPSMAALVAELERATTRGRRLAIGLGVAAAVAAGATLARRDGDPIGEVHRAAEQRISDAWGPARAAELRRAFAASGAPRADAHAGLVASALDRQRGEWLAARIDAWSAAHLRGEEGPDLTARKNACLDDHAGGLAAWVELVVAADADLVDRAPAIAVALPTVAACADRRRLSTDALPRPPAVAAALSRLRRLEALVAVGRAREAIGDLAALETEVAALPAPSLLARIAHALGDAQRAAGRAADADASLRRALQLAARARDPWRVARIWLGLQELLGHEPGRLAEATAIDAAVGAAIAQAGDDPALLARHAAVRGRLAAARGDRAAAIALLREARDRRIAALGAAHAEVGLDELALGRALRDGDDPAAALRHLERAAAIRREALGDDDPIARRAAAEADEVRAPAPPDVGE